MPKAKTDPVFAKAAKLTGYSKVKFLAEGDLDPKANELVQTIKTYTLMKRAYIEQGPFRHPELVPYPIKEQRELRSGPDHDHEMLLKGCDMEIEEANRRLNATIMANDSDVLRRMADVLDQHKLNQERATDSPAGKWVTRNPSHRLGTEIAAWAWQTQEIGTIVKGPTQSLRFQELWEHLNRIDQLKQGYSRMDYDQLKDAKKTVRRIAKEIGIAFEKEKPGPRKE